MNIREIKTSDAENFIDLSVQVEASSSYMLWETGERKIQLEDQRKMIKNLGDSNNSTILVAENNNNEIVGYLMAIGGNSNRNKHSVYIVIGILKEYRGQGVGFKLFEYLEEWAKKHFVHRLELTVVTRNEPGIALYNRVGFETEGIKRDSLLIDGEYVDEYYMSKLIKV
ncbi:GNAT family N-acetyltransferase [Tenuibacillus multivorans]|uniref:Protein N-acetyltransferase, RimJ/RimL family n=1 Tax=Tenuibacillus multivorans TaxID=237069 RepID=A0A1G9Z4Z7_9BACI|nr:GNAT family N-acetyltransferase [Tenuibacillus multivorans]GEL77400.1 N-acetyltransferase [Tenuibacillus multivorans]SDN16419.1 Protein N-acetyltransferase, RimJ/RimL family [Tenuibacillus multivorans]